MPGDHLPAIAESYRGRFELPPISYGTARDLADSTATMAGLAGANGDMKDLQRCWTVKAVLGNIAPGARLLEIGAGEPLVAALLSRLGYRVTVVDPYDGSGNGPREYEHFRDLYTDLEFVRDRFPPSQPLELPYQGIYSVSVLEHVPLDQVAGVTEGIRRFLDPDTGRSIHAVDHVLAGWGAETHHERSDPNRRGAGPVERRRTGGNDREARARSRDLLRLHGDPQPLAGRRPLQGLLDAPHRLHPALHP